MTRHHPALAIALMLVGCFVLTLNDAISKLLTDRLSVTQIMFGKSFFAVLVLGSLAPWIGPRRVFFLADWKGQAIRAGLTVASSYLFVVGLATLPLSTSITLGFVNPLYITALAPWILGEKVGVHRWAAVLIGFCGVIVIVWPSPEGFSYAVLYPLAAALLSAFRDLMTRRMTVRSTSESIIFYSVLAPMLAGGVGTGGDVLTIAQFDWILLAVSAIASLIALYFQIEAFRNAEAAMIAPFKYSNLIWVTLLDVLLWQHFPTWNIFAGAFVIILAMLYIYHRERVRASQAQSAVADLPTSSLG